MDKQTAILRTLVASPWLEKADERKGNNQVFEFLVLNAIDRMGLYLYRDIHHILSDVSKEAEIHQGHFGEILIRLRAYHNYTLAKALQDGSLEYLLFIMKDCYRDDFRRLLNTHGDSKNNAKAIVSILQTEVCSMIDRATELQQEVYSTPEGWQNRQMTARDVVSDWVITKKTRRKSAGCTDCPYTP